MAKILIISGLTIAALGVLMLIFKNIPLGRLPGDIRIEKENFTFYFPLATGLLLSGILTLIFYIAGKK